MKLTNDKINDLITQKIARHFGCDVDEATNRQMYLAVSMVVRDILASMRRVTNEEIESQKAKQVYYMSVEFLIGRSLQNNLYNLELEKNFREVLANQGFNLTEIYKIEPDAGLGNGGLGRLASCYMDAGSALNYPMSGFSIRYEFGIFKQKIVDGWQMELPDTWLDNGEVWLIPRPDEAVEVKFDGNIEQTWSDDKLNVEYKNYNSVLAVPYDMMISGYDTDTVNRLRLWGAKSPNALDMNLFSRGEYAKAMEQNSMAEAISKVLYPADDHIEGKILRLKQQYFLVSASIQNIIKEHLAKYPNLDNFADKVSIHINDTHPALCVPELMRILMDEYSYNWDKAFEIMSGTLAYTNHTVMSEALEKWPVSLIAQKLPRIYQILCELQSRLSSELYSLYPNDTGKIDYMSIMTNTEVRMANLCLACCKKINGVSKLHTDILKNKVFHDFYSIAPEKFINVTNGIMHRRWLCQANPELSKFISELCGDGFIKNASELEKLRNYKNDKNVLEELEKIKYGNKLRLCDYIAKNNGINIDPDSIFDVQVKRLHEYKRQLLNVMHILYLYNKIKNGELYDMPPRTFIFSAKASPGYIMAKQIIRLINCVANMINHDVTVRDKIKVVFIEDYKVSLAQIIIPAAEISEQISIAGKEASGTGNMKLMINGALTIGTLDGANIEMRECIGDDNIFIFGLRADEVDELWQKGYYPVDIYNNNKDIHEIIDMLRRGIDNIAFDDIAYSLIGQNNSYSDLYMILKDFDSYKDTQALISKTYLNRNKWNRMSLENIAGAGFFASDRAVREYAENIWDIKKLK